MPQWLHAILHQLQLGNVPAWGSTIVAGWSAWSAWKSSRKSKAAESEAKTQAERALGAAERSAGAAEKQAELAEKQAARASQDAQEAEAAPWDIYTRNNNDYYLQNLTNTPKYKVTLSGTAVVLASEINNAILDALSRFEFVKKLPRFNQFDVVSGRSPVALDLKTKVVDRKIIVSWYQTADCVGEPLTQRIDF